ncbi:MULTISPECIES: DUF373 family protein [unclassified Haladaptatus]|uniref:DUF373 family protein n=1 Tax=unclassified Haladaptatus TaxID=2622732 RepID=UPI0023E7D3DE|nr:MULTISPECIES: DUF373 family protein [unclassified Haladaptatus]
MTTLVVCVDRGDVIPQTGIETPVSGWESVASLVTEVGIADPEDSHVNCLLEALRITRDLRDTNEDAVVAVVSGTGDAVNADRAVARQVDQLIDRYDPESAVVVIDSTEDERLVPIIESRVRVDAVDRVVVRQARDLESTYYLLKQFLADEELRQTILVPIGAALLVFPVLLMLAESPTVAIAAITAVIGIFLLYKGLGIDDAISRAASGVRDALYSGQVSIVTYVVAAGLALVGVFAGAIGVSSLEATDAVFILAMQFIFDSVPWLAMAALTASTGRLIDESIREDAIRSSYMNLPFGVVAVGLVVRGFSAYFLERAGIIGQFTVPDLQFGAVSVSGFTLSTGTRLAVFVIGGVLISLIGVRLTSYVTGGSLRDELPE